MNSLETKKQRILQLIDQEKKRIYSVINYENPELQFLTNIWEKEGNDLVKIASDNDQTDMIIAICLADANRVKNFDYIYSTISNNKALFDTTDERKIRDLLETFADLYKYNLQHTLKEYSNPNKKFTLSSNTLFALGVKFILKTSGIKKIDIYSFLEGIDNIPQFLDAMFCVKAIAEIYNPKTKLELSIDTIEGKVKDQLCTPTHYFKKIYNIGLIRKTIFDARSYYDKQKQNDKTQKRNYKRQIIAYEELEKSLNKISSSSEIKDIKELLFRIQNKTIRLEVLKLIYLHNQAIYKKLEEEYKKLTSSEETKIQLILSEYGFLPDDYNIANISSKSLEEIKKILELLKPLSISKEQAISILENSNLQIAKDISQQISKGVITEETISLYPSIFLENSLFYQNYRANLDYFQEINFNPHYLRQNQELFFLSPEKTKENIETLQQYALDTSFKIGLNCQFLSFENLESKIDTLLELGYEDFLVEDLSLLNYEKRFNRLQILKQLNIPLSSKDELLEVLTSEKFLIPDDNLEAYIYRAIPNDKDLDSTYLTIEQLHNYSKTERTYEIGGVIISKNRVMSNLKQSPANSFNLLSSIFHNSTFTDEEYNLIIKELSHINQKAPVKKKI